MKQLVRKIHHAVPPSLRNRYSFLITFIRRLSKYLFPVTVCQCIERECGEKLTVMHIGWDQKLFYYWIHRISDDYQFRRQRSFLTAGRIPGYLNKHSASCDLAIVETVSRQLSERYSNGLVLPRWMEMVVEIQHSMKRSRMKAIVRNIQKYGFEYEIRTSPADFDLFYHQMYSPFVKARHQESADIPDYKHFYNKFLEEDCFLLFLMRNSQPVSAAFVEVKDHDYRLSAVGVKDAGRETLQMDVVGALYYFVMQHLEPKGNRFLFLGNSMPAVLDGVAAFKRLIGAEPFGKDLPGKPLFSFIPLRYSHAVKNILILNPLYCIKDTELQMVVHIHGDQFENESVLRKYFKRLSPEHVDRVKVYFFKMEEKIDPWVTKCLPENAQLLTIPADNTTEQVSSRFERT